MLFIYICKFIVTGVQFNNYGLELVKMDTTGVIVSLLLLALEADSHSTLCNIVSTNVPSLAKKTAQKPPVKEKGVQVGNIIEFYIRYVVSVSRLTS